MKRLSLDDTWEQCLLMWDWIAQEYARASQDVDNLKRQWLINNGYEEEKVRGYCFFCHYDIYERRIQMGYTRACACCPGRLVELHFGCALKYCDWENNPIEFYDKLCQLDKTRTENKND